MRIDEVWIEKIVVGWEKSGWKRCFQLTVLTYDLICWNMDWCIDFVVQKIKVSEWSNEKVYWHWKLKSRALNPKNANVTCTNTLQRKVDQSLRS